MRFSPLGLLLIVSLLSDLTHFGAQVDAACPARVRKAWGAMTAAEQNLYIEAVSVGMQRGYHILFTELESEKASSTEFFRTCGFLYWNRRFVLAYENMLRSLDPKYACITIPYWDYFADYARFLESKCENNGTSLEACSSILRGLGGSQGTARTLNINGRSVSGYCVTKAPANSFCESSTITTSTQCAGCIPRSNWAAKTFPAGFGYAGIGVVLGEANGFRDVTQGIQLGTHNAMHNALSSTMATYVSPADPVFYSLHATVDLLHQIYLECQLGDNVVPTNQNVSRWAFQQCVYKDEVSPTATSNVTQLWMVNEFYSSSATAIRAEDHPKLGQFFKPLPSKYWEFVNINQLGANSYTYQRDELILNLQRYGFVCPKRSTPISLSADVTATTNLESTATNSGSPTTNLDATTNLEEDVSPNAFRKLRETWGGQEAVVLDGSETAAFRRDQEERSLVQQQSIELLDSTLAGALEVDGTMRTAFRQAELIECEYHFETTGGVEDYSRNFRRHFGIKSDEHPRCWDLIYQMRSGLKSIRVQNWRDIVRDHYNENRNTESATTSA